MKKRNVLLAAIAAAAAAASAALGLRTLREAIAKKRVADREVADRTGAQKAPPAGRRGPARQYTDEERKERHRLAQLAYETRERAKRGEPAPLPAKDQLKLGAGPARENRKAYNRAYYLHSKKTGNQAPD